MPSSTHALINTSAHCPLKVAFVCLGCKLNFSETSTWAREFQEHGYERVDEREAANVYVMNTCSVTAQADKKCRHTIRQLKKQSPQAAIVITGCYAQLQAEQILAMDGVDLVIGAEKKPELFALTAALLAQKAAAAEPVLHATGASYCSPIEEVRSIFPAYSSGDRTRSFLKVQDGCDYHCSYCTVPLARGASRNIPIAPLVAQAQALAAEGVQEVVLTGVNTGDFGKTTGESFFDLLKALAQVEGICRWRISSIEPNLLTEDILDWIALSPSFLPHFHLPLQSGSNTILAQMRRRYNTTLFQERVAQIRARMPHAFLGIDVIVGFPGEGEAEFEETYRFLEQLAPAFLHVFPYSPRPNTPAAAFPHQVPEKSKRERVQQLMQLSNQLYAAFYRQNVGREEEVLFESALKGEKNMSGFTRNYLRIDVPYQADLIGKIASLKVPELPACAEKNISLQA